MSIANVPESDDAISRALVDARTNATPLSEFPGDVPESMSRAYGIQDASIARWPDRVAGWKVGMLPPAARERYAVERLAGPIFGSQVHYLSSGSTITMPVFVGGFAAVEAEFVIRLAADVAPVRRDWSESDVAALVGGLHVGVEIASSPIFDINSLGPAVVASDFGNNAGLLLGPEIPEWQTKAFDEMPATVYVDGEVVGNANAAAIPGTPLAALRFVLVLAAERGMELPADTLISTGASTGIHEVQVTSSSRVEFGAYGEFDLRFEPMTAGQ